MSQYDKLDSLIFDAIKAGNSRINFINRRRVLDEALRIYSATGRNDSIVSDRLQALRKRGLIEHRKGQGWSVISKEAA